MDIPRQNSVASASDSFLSNRCRVGSSASRYAVLLLGVESSSDSIVEYCFDSFINSSFFVSSSRILFTSSSIAFAVLRLRCFLSVLRVPQGTCWRSSCLGSILGYAGLLAEASAKYKRKRQAIIGDGFDY